MNTKASRLQELYNLACKKKLVKTKGEFANLIGIESGSLSHALKDDGKVSLDNTIKRAEHALMKAGIHNLVGCDNNVLGLSQKTTNEGAWFALVAEKDKQIDRLLSIIENMQSK